MDAFPLSTLQLSVSFGGAFVAGAINSVAGGGTLVSFPSLIWLGVPSVVANATNTVAMCPGSLGSAYGYRKEIGDAGPRMMALIVPSLLGGIIGAVLLKVTPPGTFDRIVPFLILFATILFLVQEPISRRLKSASPHAHQTYGAIGFQFLVALYGGYFGAGIGILMLAALGIMGLTDIHQMNGLKNIFAGCINGVAAAYFILTGLVDWRYALVMVVGAIAGGYLGAGAARKLGRKVVRGIVVAVGLAMTANLFVRAWL